MLTHLCQPFKERIPLVQHRYFLLCESFCKVGTRNIKSKENPEEEINGEERNLQMTLPGLPQNAFILLLRGLFLTTTGKSTAHVVEQSELNFTKLKTVSSVLCVRSEEDKLAKIHYRIICYIKKIKQYLSENILIVQISPNEVSFRQSQT